MTINKRLCFVQLYMNVAASCGILVPHWIRPRLLLDRGQWGVVSGAVQSYDLPLAQLSPKMGVYRSPSSGWVSRRGRRCRGCMHKFVAGGTRSSSQDCCPGSACEGWRQSSSQTMPSLASPRCWTCQQCHRSPSPSRGAVCTAG